MIDYRLRLDDEQPQIQPATCVLHNENHIAFHCDVTDERGLDLMIALREVDVMLQNERRQRELPADFPYVPILLHIKSNGGDLSTAFAIVDEIKRCASPVHTIVEGIAASAGTLISIAGTQRIIRPNAVMMIHEFSAGMWGRYRDMQDSMVLFDATQSQLIDFYKHHSNQSKAAIKKMLDHDTWLIPEKALEFGLVDVIEA